MESLILFSDGGSRGNPGPAAYGIVLYSSREKLEYLSKEPTKIQSRLEFIAEDSRYLGSVTNNQAEWQGLLAGLQLAAETVDKPTNLRVYLDSELVVKQLLGEYKVKHSDLKPLYEKAKELRLRFVYVEFIHIRREFNAQADALVNQALDRQKNQAH
jgi:ribonuclease HI